MEKSLCNLFSACSHCLTEALCGNSKNLSILRIFHKFFSLFQHFIATNPQLHFMRSELIT